MWNKKKPIGLLEVHIVMSITYIMKSDEMQFLHVHQCHTTLGARCFLTEEPRNAISKAKREAVSREKIDKRWENLWLATTVDWSYRANRFELGSRSDPVSWLEEPYRCVVIGCLLIDSYRSMIVRFASRATRGFLLPLLSLSCLVSLLRKKR